MSADRRLGPDPEELVARVLAGLRRDGLLPPKPQVAPEAHRLRSESPSAPTRG